MRGTQMNDPKDEVTKKDLQGFKEEIIHQFHIVSEGLVDQIKLLAEGHAGLSARLKGVDERLERIEKETEGLHGVSVGLSDQIKLLAEGHAGIIQRLDRMEKENERQHLETRALVKLSFSELDRRLSDLESQMKDLQEWKKEIEARLRS